MDLYESPAEDRRPSPASERSDRRAETRADARGRAGRKLAASILHLDAAAAPVVAAPVSAAPAVAAPLIATARPVTRVLRRSLPAHPFLLVLSAAWILLLSWVAVTPAFSDPQVRILLLFAAVPALLAFAWRSGNVLDRSAGTVTRWRGFIGPFVRDVVRVDAFHEVKIDCGRSTAVTDNGPEDRYEVPVSLVGTDAQMRLWRARVSIPSNAGVEGWDVAPRLWPRDERGTNLPDVRPRRAGDSLRRRSASAIP